MKKSTKIVSATAAAAAVLGVTSLLIPTQSTTVTTPETIDWNSLIPNIRSYMPKMPDTSLPKVEIPSIKFQLPKLPKPNLKSPVNAAAPKTPTIEEIVVTIPKVDFGFGRDVSKSMKRMEKMQAVFKDRRSLEHDRTIFTNENVESWFSIYDKYAEYSAKKIAVNSFRMISEVMMPKKSYEFETLKQNLSYYKSRGYDSVLIVFDGSEEPEDLKNLVKFVRYYGFESYFAFGGNESLYISIFVDPVKLKKQLQALAEYSSGIVLGWRRTSAHLLEQDDQYMNYFVDCVREINPRCAIIGEVYYGNTAKYPLENIWGFGYNLPKYASAAAIVNFGFSSVDVDSVVKTLIPSKIGNVDLIGVVVGHRPYYLTVYPNNWGQEVNQQTKEKIENKFIDAGCKGTITLHDDGRNGLGNYVTDNNLSTTLYSNLK